MKEFHIEVWQDNVLISGALSAGASPVEAFEHSVQGGMIPRPDGEVQVVATSSDTGFRYPFEVDCG